MSEMIEVSKLRINKYYRQPIGPNRMRKLRQSIIADGIKEPLIIEKGNLIIDGMIRFEIAKSLGHTRVPCVNVETIQRKT